jgi:hypothetical protein
MRLTWRACPLWELSANGVWQRALTCLAACAARTRCAQVVQKTAISGEDEVGVVEVPVSEVAEARDFNPLTGKNEAGFMLREFRLEESDNANSAVHVTLRYVPYF